MPVTMIAAVAMRMAPGLVVMPVPVTVSLVGPVVVTVSTVAMMTVMIKRAKRNQCCQRHHDIRAVIVVGLGRRCGHRQGQEAANQKRTKSKGTRHLKHPV